MKRFTYFVLFLAISSLSSCTRYLFPSIVGNDVVYQPKPMVADSVSSKFNITGGLASSDGIHDEGDVTLGYLSLTQAHTFKNFNFSYGLLGYFGKASKNYISENPKESGFVELPPFNKSTSGLGIHTSIGYHMTSNRGNTDYRIINWENAVTREFGEYLDFRNQLYGDLTYKRLVVSRNKLLWTTGLSSEIIFHHRRDKDIKHAFKLFVGFSPNLDKSFDNKIKTANYALNDSEVSRSNFQLTYFFSFKQFNLTSQADFSRLSANIGLGYSF